MKKILIISGFVALVAGVAGCKDKRSTGRAYMPDMAYSVAYETYAPTEERLKNTSADMTPSFNGRPVEGAIARGDMAAYHIKNDSTGYSVLSAMVKNPLEKGSVDLKEAERLYLVNCGICHGSKLDGNGPLYKDGTGPFSSAPKNLVSDEIKQKADGTIFHVITYGKGQMGSYASQLNTRQRWMIVDYIRSKQYPAGASAAADSTGKATTAADSTGTAMKTVDSTKVAQPK